MTTVKKNSPSSLGSLFLLHVLLVITAAAGLDVFSDYGKPTSSSFFQLDLDQRSIVAQTAKTTTDGLTNAKKIYQGDDTSSTLESLGTNVYRNHSIFDAYQTFYGGREKYADQLLLAAFMGTKFQFSLGGGKEEVVDFTKFNVEARSSAARWGTVVLHVWMAVVGALQQSLAASSCNAQLSSWDDAFALYTGSKAEDALDGGYFLYSLAQIQCRIFGTCQSKDDESPINTEIVQIFAQGKKLIQAGDCSQTGTYVERIQALLKVPLLQASLRSMYSMDLEDDVRPNIQGEASVFAAAVAPLVSMCSAGSAEPIFRDMSPGNGPMGSFEVMKSALERNYDCLGVSCADVGGIITLEGDGYLKRAQACNGVMPVPGAGIAVVDGGSGSNKSQESGGSRRGLTLGLTLGVVAVVLVVGGLVVYYKKSRKEFDTASSPEKQQEPGATDTTTLEAGETLAEIS